LEKTTWKIGELAEQTGITVRTLHHYHEKGLLIPSGTSEAGHRIYSKDDIIRFETILSVLLNKEAAAEDFIKIIGVYMAQEKDLDFEKIISEAKDESIRKILQIKDVENAQKKVAQGSTRLKLSSIL
jgi:DNA-binding transcriptional MerR regulator